MPTSLTKFQFTHPCGCDLVSFGIVNVPCGFNSRTRVGATAWLQWDNSQAPVSIHAPVWVRLTRRPLPHGTVTFQFTHPCGCDCFSVQDKRQDASFNSRTRVGATINEGATLGQRKVSIHAPVWVRRMIDALAMWTIWFQFTHPCGCDGLANHFKDMHPVSIHAPVWVRLRLDL